MISPVRSAEWVAPIVPVLKDGGTSIRICGDYKQTVNRASEVEQYPIPRIEDLFESLTGGESFTKLDLSQAYDQIPLAKESKRSTEFISQLSTLLAPLHELLKSKQSWKWTTRPERAFLKANSVPTTANVLVHFDPDKPIIVCCDDSPYGVGAVMSHVERDRSERPIGFATLSAAEKNYAQIDREGLAIVFAVKKFHNYLYGRALRL